MSCQRVQEIDLAGFLASPRDAEFASFREHYPVCRECAAEVRAWTELEVLLRGPAEHPAPELLLRFEDEPMTLAAQRRAEVDRHLAGCVSCRDELSSLRAFQPAAAPVREHAAPGLGELLATVRRWFWQPALAYALVLLLLVPLVADRWGALEEAAFEPAAPAPGKVLAVGKLRAVDDRKRDAERADADEQMVADAPAPELERLLLAEEARSPEPAPVLPRAAGKEAPAEKPAPAAAGGTAGALREQKKEQPASAPAPSRKGRRQQPAEAEVDAVSRLEVEGRVKARSRLAYNRAADGFGLTSAAPANALPLEREGDDILIDVPVPTLSGDANEIEVRVIHADGRRQLVELVEARAGATARIRVPHGWLTRGLYRVEVRVPSDPPAAARVFEYVVVSP